ncbi:hypothetical protein DFR58_11857 [Anaerobacterium chartisolvens]|uniref:Uncharacterized protein n=1 Tax=Anaerobacterium chartisolvens TaxID=1297424 RepID=A0A369AV91_9FIRM|nr:hypothetical protein [Anaerobacterium chartisolvens]RCX13239.1 hypothetical protein DFR58_11857 [Anaerobacterium chartisolvens]
MSKEKFTGIELTDEELMEMTGGASFISASLSDSLIPPVVALYGIPPIVEYGIPPTLKYGIIPVLKYGVTPLYGIPPITKDLA